MTEKPEQHVPADAPSTAPNHDEQTSSIPIEPTAQAAVLAATFDAVADSVIVYDLDDRVLFMNAAARDLMKPQSPSDYLSTALRDRVSRLMPRDSTGRPLSEQSWPVRRAQRGEVLSGMRSVDVVTRGPDGRDVWINQSAAPVRDAQGRIIGAVVISRNVTERRQLRRRTHDALNALLAVADLLVDGNIPVNMQEAPASTMATLGQRLAELTAQVLGCRRVALLAAERHGSPMQPLATFGVEPALEHQWSTGNPPGTYLRDTLPAEAHQRLLAGEVLLVDFTQPPYDTLPNPHHLRAVLLAPMRHNNELVGVLNADFSGEDHEYTPHEMRLAAAVAQLLALVIERDHLLRDREEARANELALREANRRMDEFLGVASHELRTPLTTIKMNIQLAEQRVRRLVQNPAGGARLDDELNALLISLARTNSAELRQERLVSDLLDVSRIQEGRLELRLESSDLAALVSDCVEDQRLSAPQRTFMLRMPQHLVMVNVDADRIRQVITNFLTNALKYSEADKPITVTLSVTAGEGCVSIRDEGPGIPEDERERVWERFHRARGIDVRSGSGMGLGLGLYISKTIIERHGGRVGVDSTPGEGSTFWFILPLAMRMQTRRREEAE